VPEVTDPFRATVEELRRLGDEELLAAWRANDKALAARTAGRHPLRPRHYAFRAVAVDRFGAEGHVEARRRHGC
jgi:hypothetical protein